MHNILISTTPLFYTLTGNSSYLVIIAPYYTQPTFHHTANLTEQAKNHQDELINCITYNLCYGRWILIQSSNYCDMPWPRFCWYSSMRHTPRSPLHNYRPATNNGNNSFRLGTLTSIKYLQHLRHSALYTSSKGNSFQINHLSERMNRRVIHQQP